MAKKRSVRSYLMMAKYHSVGKEKKKNRDSQAKGCDEEVGQDNFGAQTSDERTTITNESSNSIAGDSSSGYHSHIANQFYPASTSHQPLEAHQQQQQQQQRRHQSASERLAPSSSSDGRSQLVMVNERISGGDNTRMWPVMIDDELGSGANENTQQEFCNKVHLIDDVDNDDDDDAVDIVDVDSYDIDCAAAATAAAGEKQQPFDGNNISDRFHRHRYCVDSNSKASPASRFDESFQLERQRHQQQQLERQLQAANNHHRQQQYFHHHQAFSSADYHHHQQQQQPSSLQSSQFQPAPDQHLQQQQQHPSLLNGAGSVFGQQKQFVNYGRQPAGIFGSGGPLQYPYPPTNYSQQQYHTLLQYQPHIQQQQHQQQQQIPYITTGRGKQPHLGSIDSSAIERSIEDSNSSDTSNHHQHNQNLNSFSYIQNQQHQQLPSLTPSGLAARKMMMQPATSRQYLTAPVESHHHHQQQQQSPHKQSTSRRKNHSLNSSSGVKSSNHATGSSNSNSNSNNKIKPALDCCGKLAKFFLFTTNVLFWSAGVALGAWGILSLVEDHKYNLSQLLLFETSSRMSLFQLLSWSFITLGCATILVGVCGCSAIFKNNRWILGLYIFLVLAIFALDLATGLLAIIYQEKLVTNLRKKLANKLRTDYGVQASFTAAIDYIQTKYECCGLEGHFDYDQSVWRLQRLGGFEATVARTCCLLRNTSDDQAHINPRPVNESMCQSTDVRFHQSYRYRKGCLDDLEGLVRQKIWTFYMGCAAVGGIILISLMFATCFCRSIQSSSNSRKESPSIGNTVVVLSPKKHVLDKSARHSTSTGHQTSSQRHHHHHQHK